MADDWFFHRLSVRDGINTNETDKHPGTGYSSGMHTMAYLVHPGECREKKNNQMHNTVRRKKKDVLSSKNLPLNEIKNAPQQDKTLTSWFVYFFPHFLKKRAERAKIQKVFYKGNQWFSY